MTAVIHFSVLLSRVSPFLKFRLMFRNSVQVVFVSITNMADVLAQSPVFSIVNGGQNSNTVTSGVSAIVSGIFNIRSRWLLFLATRTAPRITSASVSSLATPSPTLVSSGDAPTYGSPEWVIAIGIVAAGLTAAIIVWILIALLCVARN